MKAVAADPDNALAYAQLGRIAGSYDGDLEVAARHVQKALALDPTDSAILAQAANLASALDRADDAVRLLEFAVARDPVNAAVHRSLGIMYYYAGNFDEAIDSLQTTLTLSPASFGTQGILGRVYAAKGDPETALEMIKKDQTDWKMLEIPLAYFDLGRIDASDEALAQLIEKYGKEAAVNIAAVFAYRGEADEAFLWLGKAVELKDAGLTEVVVDPLYENLYPDPRWPTFLESIGKSPQQLAAIEFDVTLPE